MATMAHTGGCGLDSEGTTMARTPADYPGRPGSKIVPNHSDFMDLDQKVAQRRAKDDAKAHAGTLPGIGECSVGDGPGRVRSGQRQRSACAGAHRPHNAMMDGGGDFGDIGGGNERPGHGYFAGQDRGRDLARELRKVRRAKRPRP